MKSKATYLLYGLSTCGKVINNTQLEINDKNEKSKKIIQIKPEKNTHNKIENWKKIFLLATFSGNYKQCT